MNCAFLTSMLRLRYLSSLVLLIYFSSSADSQSIKIPQYSVETGAVLSGGKQTPFWLMSDQYGLVTPDKFNGYIRLGLKTNLTSGKKIDYDYCLDIIDRQGSSANKLYLNQAYLRVKLRAVNFQVGSMEEKFGNQDSSISSGGLLWSGNARPMPKISILIPEYTPVPFTKGFLEFKAGISHGWFGDNQYVKDSWLHHKYFYLQLGGKLPVHVNYGFHHFVQWGGVSTDPAIGKLPHTFNDFFKVLFARTGDESAFSDENLNALGNHLGSHNFGLIADLPKIKVSFYWQTIIEDSSGLVLRNIKDGIWGISIRSKNMDRIVNGFVYELINTTDQSGPIDSYWIDKGLWAIGNDDYFDNRIYKFGWTYKNMVIGTPFITSPLISDSNIMGRNISNNKVLVHHIGVEGKYKNMKYRLLGTYYLNYGTNNFPFDPVIPQYSFMLESKFVNLLPWGLSMSLMAGIDHGRLYGNNIGMRISLMKQSSLKHSNKEQK